MSELSSACVKKRFLSYFSISRSRRHSSNGRESKNDATKRTHTDHRLFRGKSSNTPPNLARCTLSLFYHPRRKQPRRGPLFAPHTCSCSRKYAHYCGPTGAHTIAQSKRLSPTVALFAAKRKPLTSHRSTRTRCRRDPS